jgi:hypothetical protein
MSARLGKSFCIGKDGKIVRGKRKQSVSEKIRQRNSKRVRVVRRGKKG